MWGGLGVGRWSSITLSGFSLLCLQQELIYCPPPNEDPFHGRLPPSPVQCSFPGVILIPEETRHFYSPAAAGTLQGTSLPESQSITHKKKCRVPLQLQNILRFAVATLHRAVMALHQNLNGTKQPFVVALHSLNSCLNGTFTVKCLITLSWK